MVRAIEIFFWMLLFFPAILILNSFNLFGGTAYIPNDTSMYQSYQVQNLTSFKPAQQMTAVDYFQFGVMMLWELIYQALTMLLSIPSMFVALTTQFGIPPLIIGALSVGVFVITIMAIWYIKTGRDLER
jgi:hypothetical protein